MTAPTQPFHPDSAAIPKDGEYAGSFVWPSEGHIAGTRIDVYDCDEFVHIVFGDAFGDSQITTLDSAVKVREAHRARKAKLAESPTMTRDEIIKKVEWTLAMTGPDMPYDRRAVQIVDAIHPELKSAPVKTPGEVVRKDWYRSCFVTLSANDLERLDRAIDAALAAQAAADAEKHTKAMGRVREDIAREFEQRGWTSVPNMIREGKIIRHGENAATE